MWIDTYSCMLYAVYSQLINKLIHITKKFSTYIDLNFATNPNLITETGVELSIFEKSHYNLVYDIYGIINFKVLLPHSDWESLLWGATVNQKNNTVKSRLGEGGGGLYSGRKHFNLQSVKFITFLSFFRFCNNQQP